jgi:acyl carrier protein
MFQRVEDSDLICNNVYIRELFHKYGIIFFSFRRFHKRIRRKVEGPGAELRSWIFLRRWMLMEKALSRKNISDKVMDIVADQLQVDREKIKENSSFTDDLGADSLDLTELSIAFEDAFNMEIPDEDLGKIMTPSEAADYLAEHLN